MIIDNGSLINQVEDLSSLLLLGEKAVSVGEWKAFGELAIAMGNELLDKQENESIWEYNGPDRVE